MRTQDETRSAEDDRLLGFADEINRWGVAGWAFNPDRPDERVVLEITDNGKVIQQVVADHFREGLAEAGIGDGRHSFNVKFPEPLSPLSRHVVRICRVADKVELKKSGAVLEAEAAAQPDPAKIISFHIDHPKASPSQPVELPGHADLFIEGWVIADAGVAAIEISLDGTPLGMATHGLPRKGVQEAFPDRPNALLSGFAFSAPHRPAEGQHKVSIVFEDRLGSRRSAEFAVTVLPRSKEPAAWSPRRHVAWQESASKLARLAATAHQPKFTILLRLSDASRASISEARGTLQTLQRQAYREWKIALVLPDEVRDRRSALAAEIGLSPDVTADLALLFEPEEPAFVMALSAGDELGADALLEFALRIADQPGIEFLYSDERRIDASTGAAAPYFKPDWSPDLLMSTNYIGRLWAVSTTVLQRTGTAPQSILITGEYDLILRLTEAAESVGHIPRILCTRGRTSLDEAVLEQKALTSAANRRQIDGDLLSGCLPGVFRLRRTIEQNGLVSIVMPTAGAHGMIRAAISSLRATTQYRNFEIVVIENIPADDQETRNWLGQNADIVISLPGPFNWSRANNAGAQRANGSFLLFLNDDIEISDPDWLEALLEHAQRPEIGVVGARLLYPDGTVQHAGMFLGDRGGRHGFRFHGRSAPGPFGLSLMQREVIAVTGACLMVRRDIFTMLGGFDERHDLINNDLDFCLRVHRAGLRTIYTPYACLVHHEKASRATLAESHDETLFENEWGSLFAAGDPFYNVNLSRSVDSYAPEPEPVEIVFPARPLEDRAAIRRILVLKLDQIGDFITAFPAIRALKAGFPNAEITVAALSASVALAHLEPAIDHTIAFDLFDTRRPPDPANAAAFSEQLHRFEFDLAVDLRRHAETRDLLCETGARWLAGFAAPGEFPWLDIVARWDGDTQLASKRRHVSEDLLSLVSEVDLAFGPAAARPGSARTRSARIGPRQALLKLPGFAEHLADWAGDRWAAIHPAAGAENRRWPASHFAQLIALLATEEGMRCLLIGAAEDAALATSIIEAVGIPDAVRSLAGVIELPDLPRFIQACDLVVGNNSGPQHLATALGVPTVNIHPGIVDLREWGPAGIGAVSVRRATICSPCYLSRVEDCHRNLACLRGITPRDVLRACRTVRNDEKPALGR